MKYRPILVLLLFLTATGFLNQLQAQKISKDAWELATADSIKAIIHNFGQAADLYYNPESIGFDSESRDNPAGLALFRKLFVTSINATDSAQYSIDRIVNFLDPTYISAINSCAGNSKCLEDSLLNLLFKDKSYKREFSVDQYLESMRAIYDRKDVNSTILPGTKSGIEMGSILISGYYEKIASRRYRVKASAPITFSAYYIDKSNTPQLITLTDHKLIFEVSFDAVKSADKMIYANYKIDKISDVIEKLPPPDYPYLFTFQPFVTVGLQSVNGTMSNNEIVNAFTNDGSNTYKFGFILGRNLKVFRSEYSYLSVGTGVSLNYSSFESSISDLPELTPQLLETAPFTPTSSILKNYDLKSVMNKVEFNDNLWLLGIPLRLGIGFKIDPNNRVRGFLNTEVSYLMPLSSKTNSDGKVDQTGVFVYEHQPTVITEIEIGGKDNPFPTFFGEKDAYSNKGSEWESGGELKVELGANFKLKGNSCLNVGPYFTSGYLINKNTARNFLAEKGGVVYSPLNAMSRLNYLGYGITASVSFDVNKLKGK